MSTSNFPIIPDGLPLIARTDDEFWLFDEDGDCLGYCDFEVQDWESDANGDLDAWNDAARVYRLRIGCGYYSGYFVEVDDLRESGATECGRPFEEYERARLAHFLRAFAGAHGMQEYRVTARFSNGETFYEEVK